MRNTDFSNHRGKLNLVRKTGSSKIKIRGENLNKANPGEQLLVGRTSAVSENRGDSNKRDCMHCT